MRRTMPGKNDHRRLLLFTLATLLASAPALAACQLTPLERFQRAAEGGTPLSVAGKAMFPNLPVGAKLFAKTFDPTHGLPSRGDVVALCPPSNPATLYVERVIGLPGDRIKLVGDVPYLNGESLKRTADGIVQLNGATLHCYSESIGQNSYRICQAPDPGPFADTSEVVVSPGTVFVLGDNRDAAIDSRDPDLGLVKLENIVGVAVFSPIQFAGTPPAH